MLIRQNGINSINPNNMGIKRQDYYGRQYACAPNFQGNKIEKLSGFLTLPNKKLKKYSIDEYTHLTELDKKILRFEYKVATSGYNHKFYKDTEAMHDGITDLMKTNLDSKYGKGNYVVLTIGRSLSSIGKVLGYKIGEENVVNIPLSNAHRFLGRSAIKELTPFEINGLKEHLTSAGLTKDNVKKSGKNYVLMDYCCSGASLEGAIRLFKSGKLFGKNANIFIENIDNTIPRDKELHNFREAMRHYLYESKFKQYAFVGRSYDLTETSHSIIDTQNAKKMTKLMWFKLLDNFMKGRKANIDDLNNIKIKLPFLD